MDTKREKVDGMNWETGIDICTIGSMYKIDN